MNHEQSNERWSEERLLFEKRFRYAFKATWQEGSDFDTCFRNAWVEACARAGLSEGPGTSRRKLKVWARKFVASESAIPPE